MEATRIGNRILGILSILIGALVAIGPFTFVHVCGNMGGDVPACHSTRNAALILGLAIIVIGMLLFLLKSRVAGRLFSILLILAGIAGVLVPTVIAPVCSMADMHCHMYTRPFLIAISLLLACISAIFTLIVFRRRPKTERQRNA